MNVLFISDHLKSGGKERRLVELLKELVLRGKIKPVLILIHGFDANESIDYKSVLDLGIKIYYLGTFKMIKLPFEILKICKKENVNLINTWAPAVYTYLIYPCKLLLNLPILSNSITSARNTLGWLDKLKIKGTYFMCNVILSNSHQALKVFEVPKKKRLVIYNGFNQDRLLNLKTKSEILEKLDIKTKYIVAMAAEYSYRKDYPTYVKAANIVLDNNFDVTFLSMGSGNFQQYKELIDPKYEKRIIFLNRQKDVESIINATDIGVLASNVEGLPNFILECMAIGKPVLANNGDGVGTHELVIDSETGFLVPPMRPDLFANKIMELLSDENMRLQMGAKGRKIVEDKFNLNQMVNSFSGLYNKFHIANKRIGTSIKKNK